MKKVFTYQKITNKETMMLMCTHADTHVMLHYYLIKRHGVGLSPSTAPEIEGLLEGADDCFIVHNPRTDKNALKGMALRQGSEITFFATVAHPTIVYRFMKYIMAESNCDILTCAVDNGPLEKLLVKLKWELIMTAKSKENPQLVNRQYLWENKHVRQRRH